MYWLYGLSKCHPVLNVSTGREKSQWIERGQAKFGAGRKYIKLGVA